MKNPRIQFMQNGHVIPTKTRGVPDLEGAVMAVVVIAGLVLLLGYGHAVDDRAEAEDAALAAAFDAGREQGKAETAATVAEAYRAGVRQGCAAVRP